MYTTQQLFNVFKVSHQTIKNWTAEFADYLSPTATPEANRRRMFTDEDLQVFDLVKQLKGQGKRYEEIKASLGAGMRGGLPDMPHEIVPARQNGQLTAALNRVKELERLLEDQQRKTEEEKEGRLSAVGQITELRLQLKDAREELFEVRHQLKLRLDFKE